MAGDRDAPAAGRRTARRPLAIVAAMVAGLAVGTAIWLITAGGDGRPPVQAVVEVPPPPPQPPPIPQPAERLAAPAGPTSPAEPAAAPTSPAEPAAAPTPPAEPAAAPARPAEPAAAPARPAEPAAAPMPVAESERPGLAVVVPAVPPPAGAVPSATAAAEGAVAADPALIESGRHGPLPRIAADGRMAWRVYGRPVDQRDDRARVAVVVTGLGLSAAATERALRQLPPAVTLAFNPYASKAEPLAAAARSRGHEVLLTVPVQADDPAFRDAGPWALSAALPWPANADRLDRVLARVTGYVGVIVLGGSGFARAEPAATSLLTVARSRGLMVVDGVLSPNSALPRLAGSLSVPRVIADLWLDDRPDAAAVDAALARLTVLARERAMAVGLARPYPVSLDRIAAWAAGLDDREFVLVPITALADRQVRP